MISQSGPHRTTFHPTIHRGMLKFIPLSALLTISTTYSNLRAKYSFSLCRKMNGTVASRARVLLKIDLSRFGLKTLASIQQPHKVMDHLQ